MKILLISIFLLSCSHHGHRGKHGNKLYLSGTAWTQASAEREALSYQAFNTASDYLDDVLKKRHRKKLAIVVDVDETVLDNSPYQAYNILEKRRYTGENWTEWVNKGTAKPISGAVDFLNRATKKGVTVFYITNRSKNHHDMTYKNLLKEGFPIKEERLMVKGEDGNKEERRQRVLKNYKIVIFMGDTMADFHEDYEKKSPEERIEITNRFKKEFGRKYVILPNLMYGDWENSLFQYDRTISGKKKKEALYKALKPYQH